MMLISAFLLAFAFTSAYREDHSDKYIDEVLSVHLHKHVKNADLDVYEMPDFYFNLREFSVDNVENVGTVTFYRGNLTGLKTVQRRFCQHSLRSTDSVSIICNIVLPRVDLRYRGRYEISTESSSSYKDQVRQRDFFGDISVRNIEAQFEVKTSADGDQSSVTNLLLLSKGEYRRGFQYNDVRENRLYNNLSVPFEEISEPFYKRSFYVFQQVFYGSFRSALERAVASVSYPHEHY
ncbi:uncharacterized protein TNIN_384641 [Trichonephila inaurata madagascariensis]|uniref:Secreted protein n=1 Tax=Trichonephila inaurata madagascariensis TaxID=2747483 RepID=A0A8X6X784_9ARAC|nr:uncharacterized protein TNIN_145001 [Trichonephila inaurata madagascariensis]GFY48178.1 uncharacterized protein TNIN_384641 [Trichonephila inaurata madagascariensis]